MSANVLPVTALGSAYAAAAAYVHFRGRERLSFMRQITDQSTFLAPYNAFVYLTSSVPTTPMQDVDAFPALAPLRTQWQTIADLGVLAYRTARVIDSTVTGNGTSSDCGTTFVCVDILSRRRPLIRGALCDTSFSEETGTDWNVCRFDP